MIFWKNTKVHRIYNHQEAMLTYVNITYRMDKKENEIGYSF